MDIFRSAVAALAAVTLLSTSFVQLSYAQTPPEEGGEGEEGEPADPPQPQRKEWAEGVPEEEQKAANKLYKEGNGLVRDSFLTQAVDKYTEALTHWDHPAIHYNLAIALIGATTERPLEAHEHLTKALGYDGRALSEDELKEANRYLSLVKQQLITITVVCTEPDAEVYLDGKKSFTGPGQQEHLLRAGEHTISASKPGYETAVVTQIIPGGEDKQVTLKLYRPEDLTRYSRRFQPWLPYAVAGGGLLVVGIGGLLHASAASSYDDYDAAIRTCVDETEASCEVTSDIQGLRDSGDTKQAVAVSMYFIGGAAIATGLTLLVLNRAKPYRIDGEQAEQEGVAVVPVIGRDRVGVSAAFRF